MMMGDYRLEEVLAIGGMARVYIGIDPKLERRAAVKVLELNQDWVDETIIARFEREAKAVAALDHPNIITIYQYGTQQDAYFIAMRYIEGKDLRQVLRDHQKQEKLLPLERTLNIMRQVAAALDFAHQRGLIHRDIKPSNILLTPDDRAILTDFGLVLSNSDKTLGTAFGTPRYIAPEQAVASQQAVPQSDIYALAVIAYEMIAGSTPFDGDTPMEIALAHVSEEPEPPSKRQPSIPASVDAVLLKALNKLPEDRYPTAHAFIEALASAYANPKSAPVAAPSRSAQPQPAAIPSPVQKGADYAPPQAKRKSNVPLLLGALVLLLLLGGGGFFAWQQFGGGSTQNNAEVVLYYNENSLVIHNTGDYTLQDTQRLTFVRGAVNDGGDDYSGDRIPRDLISAGRCFRIELQSQPSISPPQCGSSMENREILTNSDLFFWRRGNLGLATFEVRWDNRVIARCDTVNRDVGECRFNYPLDPPTPQP